MSTLTHAQDKKRKRREKRAAKAARLANGKAATAAQPDAVPKASEPTTTKPTTTKPTTTASDANDATGVVKRNMQATVEEADD